MSSGHTVNCSSRLDAFRAARTEANNSDWNSTPLRNEVCAIVNAADDNAATLHGRENHGSDAFDRDAMQSLFELISPRSYEATADAKAWFAERGVIA